MHRFVRIALCLVVCVSTLALVGLAWPLSRSGEIISGELIPLASWQKRFQITEGKDRGKMVPIIFHHDPLNGQRWKLIFGGYGSILMRSDASGTLMMERMDLFKSRSYIVYEPALPILPGDKTPAAAMMHQASFKMYDAESGRLKRSGRATHLVKEILPSQFATPAGLIDGFYIDIEHGMVMPFARLHFTLRLGCRLDDGPVYGSAQYTLKKLGVFSETKTAAAALDNR